MNIYKYGLTQDKEIYILECPVLQKFKGTGTEVTQYDIQEPTKKKWIFVKDLEQCSNKVMYSTSPDKKDEYVRQLKEAYNNAIENYLKKAEDSKKNLEEILRVNKLI